VTHIQNMFVLSVRLHSARARDILHRHNAPHRHLLTIRYHRNDILV